MLKFSVSQSVWRWTIMENSNEIKNALIDWLESWRDSNGIDNGVKLEGEILDKFVSELHGEIVGLIGDFGQNTISDTANLVLYSGQDYNMVKEFCEASNGKYYMISNTAADILWNETLRDTIAITIGEDKATDPITARVLEGKVYNADETWSRTTQYATDSNTYLALDDFISSKIAEAGLEKGNIIYIISDTANPNSVGLMTEIPTVFNYKDADGVSSSNAIEVVTNLIKNEDGTFTYEKVDCSNATVYFTDDGNVKYVDMLESLGSEGTYVGQSQFTTTLKEYLNYSQDSDMTTKYKDYDSYTALEKLQAKQYDYEKRLIADMIDRGVTSENGIELLSKEELRNKYSFIGDNVDDGVIKELQLSDYRNKKYGIDSAKDMKIYMDETGNVTVASNQKYASIDIENVEANAKFSTTVDDYLNYTDDAEMKATYNDYELLEGIERVEAKQLDLEMLRNIMDELKKNVDVYVDYREYKAS